MKPMIYINLITILCLILVVFLLIEPLLVVHTSHGSTRVSIGQYLLTEKLSDACVHDIASSWGKTYHYDECMYEGMYNAIVGHCKEDRKNCEVDFKW